MGAGLSCASREDESRSLSGRHPNLINKTQGLTYIKHAPGPDERVVDHLTRGALSLIGHEERHLRLHRRVAVVRALLDVEVGDESTGRSVGDLISGKVMD